MLSGLYIFCLLAGSVLAPAPQPTTSTNATAFGDCAEKHELCTDSCLKQRQACDRNTPNDPRCVSQQNQCEAGCYKAWKSCEENSGSKLSARLAF